MLTYFCLQRVFRRMDEDGNKQLNIEEFILGLEESGLDLTKDEITEIFEKIDTDNNGGISIDEFLVAVRVSRIKTTLTFDYLFTHRLLYIFLHVKRNISFFIYIFCKHILYCTISIVNFKCVA